MTSNILFPPNYRVSFNRRHDIRICSFIEFAIYVNCKIKYMIDCEPGYTKEMLFYDIMRYIVRGPIEFLTWVMVHIWLGTIVIRNICNDIPFYSFKQHVFRTRNPIIDKDKFMIRRLLIDKDQELKLLRRRPRKKKLRKGIKLLMHKNEQLLSKNQRVEFVLYNRFGQSQRKTELHSYQQYLLLHWWRRSGKTLLRHHNKRSLINQITPSDKKIADRQRLGAEVAEKKAKEEKINSICCCIGGVDREKLYYDIIIKFLYYF